MKTENRRHSCKGRDRRRSCKGRDSGKEKKWTEYCAEQMLRA